MLFVVGSATFIGCGNEDHHEHTEGEGHEHAEGEEHHHDEAEAEEAAYYCPMKCEGEKTYAEEGSCPKCGMDLVEVE